MTQKLVVTIVGFGNVGRTIALLLMNQYAHHKLILNVIELEGAVSGSILDLRQTMHLINSDHQLIENDYRVFEQSDFIIHCAGASVPAGASRRVIRDNNIKITEEIFLNREFNKNTIIIVVSNPVDTISYVTQRFSRLPSNQVIGVGTFLDTSRFRFFARQELGKKFNNQSILLGEHGDAIVYMSQYDNLKEIADKAQDHTELIEICMNATKQSAAEIKKTQDASYYAVSLCVVDMIELMLEPNNSILPLSVVLPKALRKKWELGKVYMSLPVRLNRKGIESYEPIRATEEEWNKLKSAVCLLASLQEG